MKAFFTNGVIQKTVVTDQRATKIIVRAEGGVKCGAEWPHIRVSIDDREVMSEYVEGVNQKLEAPISLPAGTHVLKVRFDNDYYEPSNAFASDPPLPMTCDRNLLIGAVQLVDDSAATLRLRDRRRRRRRPPTRPRRPGR